MKTVALIALVVASLIPSAGAITPGPAQIKMTGKVEVVERPAPGNTTTTYGLYASGYKGRIGTEVLVCGTRSNKWRICLAFLRTPRGTLTAQGLTPLASRFTILGVLGGTGIYSNVGGSLTLVAGPDGTQTIIGDLVAF